MGKVDGYQRTCGVSKKIGSNILDLRQKYILERSKCGYLKYKVLGRIGKYKDEVPRQQINTVLFYGKRKWQ